MLLMLFSCSKDLPFFEELGLTTISLMGDEEGDDPDALTPLWDAFLAWMNGESSSPPDGIGDATPLYDENGNANSNAYNCHFYAWGPSDGGNNPEFPSWSQTPNTDGYHSLDFSDPNQVGDRVVYYGVDENGNVYATHSGIVTGVDENGMATQITSKWGQMGLYEHAPTDVPASYGEKSPTFEHNGQMYMASCDFR